MAAHADTSVKPGEETDPAVKKIVGAVEKQYQATNITMRGLFDSRYIGKLYYFEFESDLYKPEDNNCYVLIERSGEIKIFDTIDATIQTIGARMDASARLVHKLGDFTFSDIVSMFVVVVLSVCLVVEALRGTFSKELIGLFGIVVGYLFGKGRGAT